MIDDRALRRAFSDYADALIARYDIGDVLYRLTDQVVEALPVDGAGVSLGHEVATLQLVTATNHRISRLEDAQIASGDGPLFKSFRAGEVVAIEDIELEDRWPRYRETLLAEGFRAVAGIPMPVSERRIGALDLYREQPGPWSREELDVGQLLANIASGYILNREALEESRTLAGQLQHALDSRVVIEQAKGMLAAKHGTDLGEAFERLRQQSRNTSTRLHEVCRAVVAGELDL